MSRGSGFRFFNWLGHLAAYFELGVRDAGDCPTLYRYVWVGCHENSDLNSPARFTT